MKARKGNKAKSWCWTCRGKPQTLDSDLSDWETEENARNKVEIRVENEGSRNQEERQNVAGTSGEI